MTAQRQESRPLHPDVRKRRSAAVLAMAAALEHRPTPTTPDQRAFLVCLADLARICLPNGPDSTPSDDDLRVLAFGGMMSRSNDRGYRETNEIFDGELLIDGAYYQIPDSRRGPYAGAPEDPETNPRRLVARMVLRILQQVTGEEKHLTAARDLLTWAVDAPPLARELMTRRVRTGKSRSEIAATANVSSVSTVSNWESGRTIPHRHDWPGLCDAYGFTQEEFVRFLDRTGPPERRGAPSREPAEPDPGATSDRVDVPHDDCDVQKRRVTQEAPRLGAYPVWQDDVDGLPGIGGWFIDILQDEDDADDPGARRRRSGPSTIPRSAPESGSVLGPVSLSALMHRSDWAMFLLETSGPLGDHATRQVAARQRGTRPDGQAVAAALETAAELGFAYQHARLLHSLGQEPPASDLEAAAERGVADALSKVAVLTVIFSR
ncbi:helix-turn-helix transcriptional regulator [Streptomyces sp. NPDC097610]|uniref:helix-turn-helix domain-containing protein n=1 Tax=Streptomyces sp. NPDC097610 TaxID=3157227 RepID=UPI00332E37C6